jgi:hypothetical protein
MIDLRVLIKNPVDENAYLAFAANALIYHRLGKNYFDSEEITASFKYFTISLKLFNMLTDSLKLRYINSIQDVLNHIGIIHCNKDRFSIGLPFLSKSKQLFEIGKKMKSHSGEINNVQRNFLRGIKTDSKVATASEEFRFFIDGGLDSLHLERNYT